MADELARERRRRRMHASLVGLSVGDAFGERFFGDAAFVLARIAQRLLPEAPTWRWTDDTAMALSICEVLARHDRLEPDELAVALARRWAVDPNRGYGSGAVRLLEALLAGADWRVAAPAAFGGMGSMGNGAAMRVAPLGAYFADDVGALIESARASAAVTHAHAEAQAGAIAVAVAAAHLVEGGAPAALWDNVLAHTPASETRERIGVAAALPGELAPALAADRLGSGQLLLTYDTVPFALFCATHYAHDFAEAMWATVAGLGDRDTTCAIVGGLLGALAPPPAAWLARREPLLPYGQAT